MDDRGRRRREARRSSLAAIVGSVALVATWSWLAASRPAVILPSPLETWEALEDLAASGDLLTQLGRTSVRAVVGAALAVAVGLVLGLGMASSPVVEGLVRPLRGLAAGAPPIVLVVVALVWFGSDGRIAVFVAALVMLPEMMVVTAEASRGIDRSLRDVSSAFGVPRWWALRHVHLPAISGPVGGAAAVAFAGALRLTLMVELLAAPDGIGAHLASARTNLDTPTVFAWTAVAVVFAIAVERAILHPVRRRGDGGGTVDGGGTPAAAAGEPESGAEGPLDRPVQVGLAHDHHGVADPGAGP